MTMDEGAVWEWRPKWMRNGYPERRLGEYGLVLARKKGEKKRKEGQMRSEDRDSKKE